MNQDQPDVAPQPGTGAGWGQAQSKTISWHDPRVTARALAGLSGLEAMSAIRDGAVAPPPIAAHFDFRVLQIEPGRVSFGCNPDASAYNPIGMVHGGLVCTLLDTVLGCAVHTTLPPGVGYTSIELKVNYLRPVHLGAELTGHGWVTKPGRLRRGRGAGRRRQAGGHRLRQLPDHRTAGLASARSLSP
ncbi:MAG TPA: PaaI family thioesterase [Jatrophihabitans sp.]|nr:PaaI family thioesterase [Jatrophihabitans sp.]